MSSFATFYCALSQLPSRYPWQGNPARRLDDWRSFRLELLAALACLPGVRLVSLQVEHGLDQLDGDREGSR